MEELCHDLEEHGYTVSREETLKQDAVVEDIARLMALSVKVEQASLQLKSLQNMASFEELLSPASLESKIAMLKDVAARVEAIIAGKDQILAFIQRNHAWQGPLLAIEASKHAKAKALFDGLAKHMEDCHSTSSLLDWGSSDVMLTDYKKIHAVLAALTKYQAHYQRALDCTERLTQMMEDRAKRRI